MSGDSVKSLGWHIRGYNASHNMNIVAILLFCLGINVTKCVNCRQTCVLISLLKIWHVACRIITGDLVHLTHPTVLLLCEAFLLFGAFLGKVQAGP